VSLSSLSSRSSRSSSEVSRSRGVYSFSGVTGASSTRLACDQACVLFMQRVCVGLHQDGVSHEASGWNGSIRHAYYHNVRQVTCDAACRWQLMLQCCVASAACCGNLARLMDARNEIGFSDDYNHWSWICGDEQQAKECEKTHNNKLWHHPFSSFTSSVDSYVSK
jgi:hypothetical protein